VVLPLPSSSSSGAMPRSYAVPAGLRRTHAVGAKCAKAKKDETISCWTPTRGEAAFEYWVALMVPSEWRTSNSKVGSLLALTRYYCQYFIAIAAIKAL